MLVYLAGPVDGVDIDAARGWRDVATAELLKLRPNIATFSPPHGISAGGAAIQDRPTCEQIMSINHAALEQADYVLANMVGPSVGTPMEIQIAWEMATPVIGFADLARMQKSIYQHRFFYLAIDLTEALERLLCLFHEEEDSGRLPERAAERLARV